MLSHINKKGDAHAETDYPNGGPLALGAKLAKGRSPLVAALVTLLATRMLTGREESEPTKVPSPSQSGLNELVEKFRQGGFEDIIKLDWHRHE